MRCPACNGYVPEGLSNFSYCPQCGKPLSGAGTKATPEPAAAPSKVYAPFLTIKTHFSFGPALVHPEMGLGSLSFGPEGLSIVTAGGNSWKKVPYTDIAFLRQDGAKVLFETSGVDSRIEFPDSILANGEDRAKIVVDIFEKLKGHARLSENPFSESLSEEIAKRMK